MTWARRLRELAFGQPAAETPEIRRELAGYHLGFQERARRMAAHAALTPSATCEEELSALAADHERLAHQLGAAMTQRGVDVPSAPPRDAAAPPAINHWARLVQDLQGVRRARDALLEAATRIGDIDPPLGELLGALSRECEAHAIRLRGLIARADPQALN